MKTTFLLDTLNHSPSQWLRCHVSKRAGNILICFTLLCIMGFVSGGRCASAAGPLNSGSTPAPTVSDANWLHGGTRQGPNGPVYAMAVDKQDNLYIGGQFTHVGDRSAPDVARWNGSEWSRLGSGLSSELGIGDGSVTAMTIDPSGTIFVSGDFSVTGTNFVQSGILRWDGTKWSMILATNGLPLSFFQSWQLLSDSKGGFYTRDGASLLHWDEQELRVIGAATYSAYTSVDAIARDAEGAIFVGGSFTNMNEVVAWNAARWDGQGWHAMGAGPGGQVQALLSDRPGQVYAGGSFFLEGNRDAVSVVHWDGQHWEPVGSALPGSVTSLARGLDGILYAGVSSADDSNENTIVSVHAWDGKQWTRRGGVWTSGRDDSFGGSGADVVSLAVDSSNRIYLGGSFHTEALTNACGVAQWDGNRWAPVGKFTPPGLDGEILALASGPAGSLYVGGEFRNAGSFTANGIAQWTAGGWRALGGGVSGETLDEYGRSQGSVVLALAEDQSGGVVAAGRFTHAGGVLASNIARWDGTTWKPMASGLAGAVTDLAFGTNNTLWAAGTWTSKPGVAGGFVAQWDGTQWTYLDKWAEEGVGSPRITVSPSGDLILANFGVYRWAGKKWVNLNLPVVAYLSDAVFDAAGNLYVAGAQSGIDDYFHFVARYDGSRWTALVGYRGDNGHNFRPVYSLAADEAGNVYMGGRFQYLWKDFYGGALQPFLAEGEVDGNNLLRWDGQSLSAVAGGVPGEVRALAFDSYGNLFVGGASGFGTDDVMSPHGTEPGMLSQLLLSQTSLLDSLEPLANGGALVRGRGTPGYSYVLETASRVDAGAVWIPLVTNRLSQPAFSIVDRVPASQRFYRSRFLP